MSKHQLVKDSLWMLIRVIYRSKQGDFKRLDSKCFLLLKAKYEDQLKMKCSVMIALLLILAALSCATTVIVGGGDEVIEVPVDFSRIQAALDSLNPASTEHVTILISPGIYNEKVTINRSNVTLEGINRDTTIITYAPTYRYRYMTLWIDNRQGPLENIRIENLTIKNTNELNAYGIPAQEALAIGANTYDYNVPSTHTVIGVEVYNCDLGGYQDTVFVYPWSYEVVIENCSIEGGFDILSVWNSEVIVIDSTFDSRHVSGHRPLFVSTAPGNLNERRDTYLSLINCQFKSSATASGLLSFNASDGSVIQSLIAENNHLEEPLASILPKFIYWDGANYPGNVEIRLGGNNGQWEIPQTTRVEEWRQY